MRKRLFLLILLTTVPVLFALAWYMGEQSFQLSLSQEKQRAQMTESIIFQEIRQRIGNMTYSQAVQAAKQYRDVYAAQGVELIFCWSKTPMAGATLPNPSYEGLLQGSRAAMLDTVSDTQRYAVAEPLNSRLTLIFLRDVSGLFALRDQFRLTALLSALAASLLLGFIGLAAAGIFTRPIRKLTKAADKLSMDTDAELSLPVHQKDEVGALARAFGRLQSAVKSREETLRRESEGRQMLLDALAHEIRTPLTSLLGNARLLQKDIPFPDRAQIGESMVNDIRRLSGMDEQLMKLTRLKHNSIEHAPVAVLPLLHETAERLKFIGESIRVTVTGEDAVIFGDKQLLSLLADNLAVNAIRASSPGQEIILTALPHGFSVADQGIGMTEEQIAHACEPFWKADKARTREQGGTGLGLTLCSIIADLHKGSMTFFSAVGQGTTVTFTAPLHPVADSVTTSAV
ncbi:MAG: HAMP domain-containing histidine kinase [Clostridia bacterium]|nr:HAMP domain-containing histidine kinase [Clostridia bacterium]